ncbi:hypothetical protein BpHYR1_034918 [Brachionus plicatilis]|uniref:Uncharacterized protein n=1 Tax=Brachionus plicatilis TaxID=10195 RepID=A0A3M7RXS7_BRAPC|nr:hypothetical protein BpHYR1_034918 [Brachionus plicatilis]
MHRKILIKENYSRPKLEDLQTRDSNQSIRLKKKTNIYFLILYVINSDADTNSVPPNDFLLYLTCRFIINP